MVYLYKQIKRMKKTILLALSSIALIACNNPKSTNETVERENPILQEWDTPFGLPPFDKIESEDYLPAYKIALAEHQADIDAIINNTEAPTFKNTIEGIEFAGKNLTKISSLLSCVEAANTDSILKATKKELAPITSAHYDNIMLNEDLFAKVKAVYDQKETLNLTPIESYLLEEKYKDFTKSGINLGAEDKEKLKEINGKLAELTLQYGNNLLDETNSFEYHTTDSTDLGSLPTSLKALAKQEATKRGHESGWSFTVQRPSINPFLQSSPNRKARKILYDAYAQRANNDNDKDNKKIIKEIVSLRIDKAKLLGFKNHASRVLENNMAEKPENVLAFMDKMWPFALAKAKEEKAAMNKIFQADGNAGDIQGHDWRYYVEKVRKERYNFDEEETRPYFEVSAVTKGVFELANKLFGMTFIKRTDLPIWHPEQEVFEVKNRDGSHCGIMYLDFFARDSKRGGAWMNSIRKQSNIDGMIHPVVTTNYNYPAPTENSPSLLSYREAETLFHEFGHAIHGLLSNVKYRSLSGTAVPRDFVEFPSQVMENWMGEPEVLQLFAKHYKTGEVIPEALIKKLKDANSFNGGFGTVEYMAAAYLDMYWHTLEAPTEMGVNEFEAKKLTELGLIDVIQPRYRSTYFSHIFSGGYSAGYYSYQWSEVLDADCFNAFKETGNLFDPTIAKRYQEMMSKGGSEKGMKLYTDFRGQEPDIKWLLEKKGFIE